VDFELAFRHKGLTNKWFSIHLRDSNQAFPRLGLVVSKRIMARSVDRNFAKRIIREIFRLNSFDLPSKDFVVRIRKKLSRETSNEARAALQELILTAKFQ
jgi:ribonuclease P protein component